MVVVGCGCGGGGGGCGGGSDTPNASVYCRMKVNPSSVQATRHFQEQPIFNNEVFKKECQATGSTVSVCVLPPRVPAVVVLHCSRKQSNSDTTPPVSLFLCWQLRPHAALLKPSGL